MKSKPKRPAARNPFVALALKRRAGAHRKPNKAVRRSEKVNLKINGGCSSKVEQSGFNRPARVRFPSSHPEHCRERSRPRTLPGMFCPNSFGPFSSAGRASAL